MTETVPSTGRRARPTLADRALVTASCEIEVAFPDVDAAGIVWHGHYFRYFEIARAVLLRKIGYDYPQMRDSGFAWPLVDCQARFVGAITYAQILRVEAGLVEWENRMRVQYEIRDAASHKRLATGETLQCAVTLDTWEMQLVSPACLLDRVKAFL